MDSDRFDELLLTVRKPGRYVGGEWNSVRKEWTGDRVKVLLAFPDVYEVGMSYLGTKILYGILNGRDDCLAERAFAPWPDFEAVLRSNAIPLYGLESRRAMREFDIVGFSLAYELTYTNVLNMLDLGGVPVRSADRTDKDPLVIAGGPSAFNPEPMAEFIDAFAIGDGEDAIGDIVDAYKRCGPKGPGSRARLLKALAGIEGVYVPSLYKAGYGSDGVLGSLSPLGPGIPPRIAKRAVRDFDEAFYPVDQIVPNIGIVHDRLSIEIMRGCKHACRFCQAASVYRPARERSAARICELAKAGYRATGYDEISLLSLSSADHSGLKGAIDALNAEFCPKAVSISVPSLRIEDVIKDLPALISKVKKSGLTFAPEAGSETLRRALGKDIKIERLFEAATASFRSGWRKVKLYFMIGLPGETEADIAGIADIVAKVSALRREVDGHPAEVTVSINAFVPKPHTAFEREPMDGIATLRAKIDRLRSAVRSKAIKLDFHPIEMSRVEAVVSRGGRPVSGAIYEAWRSGARFDGWTETFDPALWAGAMESSGVDPERVISRRIPPEEILPWALIDSRDPAVAGRGLTKPDM